MKKQNYQDTIKAKKDIKRYLITALCTAPILICVGILLGAGFNRVLRILIFVVILLVVLFTEEYIYAKIKKNKPEVEKTKKEDVFK